MTMLDDQETAVHETQAMETSNGLRGGMTLPLIAPYRRTAPKRRPTQGRLEATVLGHLPLAVAVIDADIQLLYWNEQAAALFGKPPLIAAANPPLFDVLSDVANITLLQKNRIVAFAASHIAKGDRTEPESRLRLSLTRERKITVQVHGLGMGRWMLVIDEGKLGTPNLAIGSGRAAMGAGDAWLDALTGLGNRRQFNQVLRDMLETATSEDRHAILLIDLDGFAPVNDTLGHPVGDALLCLVAQRLRRETRDDDLLMRLGGDEFVVVIQNGAKAEALAGRIANILSRPFLVEGHIANIGASIGVVRFPDQGATADDLIRHAELALYDAKSAGRQTWRVYGSAMAAAANSRRSFETDLRKALTLGEFSLAYQAQLNVRTQTVTGFEALLRWNHPTRGNVEPGVFIPVAEDIGCIVALGEWVLKAACNEAIRWPAGLCVAVNVSPRQFEDSERLYQAVQSASQTSGLAAARLELEITETALLSREPHVLAVLHRLRALGIRIAMDDFGTGYASVSQLLSFPFDKIKIDRTFIAGLGQAPDAAAVIQAISALGSGLGMTTTAEGVETAEQAARVAANGCADIQGFLVGRPIPSTDIDAALIRYIPVLQKVSVSA